MKTNISELSRYCLLASLLGIGVGCGSSENSESTATATSSGNFTLNGAASGASLLASTPSVAKMSIYQFAVSESENCTDPVIVIDNGDTPKEFDMLDSPQLGSGTVADGTYPCVIMVMSSSLAVAASETDAVCTANEEFTQSVCGGGESGEGLTMNFDGVEQACGGTKKAYLYLSTGSTLTRTYEQSGSCDARFDEGDDSICNSFFPPNTEDTALGVPLGEALVVNGEEVGVFTLSNLSVGEDGDDRCGMDRPNFTFTAGN